MDDEKTRMATTLKRWLDRRNSTTNELPSCDINAFAQQTHTHTEMDLAPISSFDSVQMYINGRLHMETKLKCLFA